MGFWYRRSYTFLAILLLPLSWVFRSLVAVRRFLYRIGVKKTVFFSVPVIVVGNITIGGTGKTPLVIWLANFLKKEGWKPGIVSRGAGGKKQFKPTWVDSESEPERVGDEAILMAKRSGCPVVVGIDRVAAVKALLANTDCNIVICDDGLQHYRLGRFIEIAVLDSERRLGNHCFLPAGPLREAKSRLKTVDFVIENGATKQGVLTMQLLGDQLASVDAEKSLSIDHLKNQTVHAIAGIGNPGRFFTFLRDKGLQVIEHVFPDHYLYREADFAFKDSYPIIMTEKDAVKCKKWADKRFWCLPVDAKIDKVFQVAMLAKLRDFKPKSSSEKVLQQPDELSTSPKEST